MRIKKYKVTKKMLKGYDEDFIEKYAGEYTIKEWLYGDKQDALELASEQFIDPETGDLEFKTSPFKFQTLKLIKCVKFNGQDISESFARGLSNKIAKKLNEYVNEVNKEDDEDSEEGKS